MMTNTYQEYVSKLQKIADLKYAAAVLQWDEETYMPTNGYLARGRQIATLNEMAHVQSTDVAFGDLIAQLKINTKLTADEQRNVSLTAEDFERNKKLPATFIRQISEATNVSYHAWVQARKKNDFSVFEKPLQTIIDLKRQEANYLGFDKHPYNALMNDYDKGLTTEIVDTLFSEFKPQLQALLQKIAVQPIVDDSFLKQHFDKNIQWEVGLEILKRIHFNFDAGRQDISEHPFTTNFSSQDVRVTTRIDENDFSNMLWSCIHEGGHALYEQGLPITQYGLPLGEYCSLSIHESQSRLWENNIGRGLPFWQYNFALLQQKFGHQFSIVSIEQFYKAINKVQPSLIRTEADEITYHFHIIIRYEIEKLLIEGSIQASDIPSYWNELYKKHLGVIVPTDAQGCLQDVHWSHGSFGYFPTYTIGSLYAAQFFETMVDNDPTLPQQISLGNTEYVFNWLQSNIYKYGRQFSSNDLCKLATGKYLTTHSFIKNAYKKWS